MTAYRFPKGFKWGTATSAYQVEGAAQEDGRGPSIWDEFCATPGKSHEGQSGLTACDHYHRWAEDLDLVRAIGFGSYRFSVAWPRVFPDGVGPPNHKGPDLYNRIIDGCMERGIELFVSENGCGYPDKMDADGRVEDFARIQYLRSHLRMVHRAVKEGLPVRGYHLWSLLDNFEWAYGYSKRFGIVHVNYETFQRTPKLSARWMRPGY